MQPLNLPMPGCSFHSPMTAAQRRSLIDEIGRFNERLPDLKPAEAVRLELSIRRKLAGWISRHRRECDAVAYAPDTIPGGSVYEEARQAHHDVRPTENLRRIAELQALAC